MCKVKIVKIIPASIVKVVNGQFITQQGALMTSPITPVRVLRPQTNTIVSILKGGKRVRKQSSTVHACSQLHFIVIEGVLEKRVFRGPHHVSHIPSKDPVQSLFTWSSYICWVAGTCSTFRILASIIQTDIINT